MAITLNDLKPKSLKSATRTLEHDSGVTLTIEYDGDKGFERAFARLHEIEAEEKKEDVTKALSKAYNSDDRLTSIERQLFVMGEFLVKDWDGVNDADGEKVEVNGANLIKLCAAISDDQEEQVAFMTKLFELIGEAIKEFGDLNSVTKKKPSKSTSTAKKP